MAGTDHNLTRGDRVAVLRSLKVKKAYQGQRGVIERMDRGNVWVRFDDPALNAKAPAFRAASLRRVDDVVERLAELGKDTRMEFKPTVCTEAAIALGVEVAKLAVTAPHAPKPIEANKAAKEAAERAIKRVRDYFATTGDLVGAGAALVAFQGGGGSITHLFTASRDDKQDPFIAGLKARLLYVADADRLAAEQFRYETQAIGVRALKAAGVKFDDYAVHQAERARVALEDALKRKLTPEERTAVEGPHECAEDNQGLCHTCGKVLNEERWREYHGDVKPGIKR